MPKGKSTPNYKFRLLCRSCKQLELARSRVIVALLTFNASPIFSIVHSRLPYRRHPRQVFAGADRVPQRAAAAGYTD